MGRGRADEGRGWWRGRDWCEGRGLRGRGWWKGAGFLERDWVGRAGMCGEGGAGKKRRGWQKGAGLAGRAGLWEVNAGLVFA